MERAEKGNGAMWSPEKQIQDAEVLELLKKESGGKFAPGTSWSYSNSGYVVLGLIVATNSGPSYVESLRSRVLSSRTVIQHTYDHQRPKTSSASSYYLI